MRLGIFLGGRELCRRTVKAVRLKERIIAEAVRSPWLLKNHTSPLTHAGHLVAVRGDERGSTHKCATAVRVRNVAELPLEQFEVCEIVASRAAPASREDAR